MIRPFHVLLVVLCACSSQQREVDGADGGMDDSRRDSDRDGLCDMTEADKGTDPRVLDTDGDTLPDGLEVALGYSPVDSASPDASRLVSAANAASLRIRFSVDGSGDSYKGLFLPISSPFSTAEDATSLLDSNIALEALPADNVRDILAKEQRFDTVTGSTRLAFELTFDLTELDPVPCTVAHPFSYALTKVGGGLVEQQKYLLVIPGETDSADPPAFCPPSNCI